MPNEYVILRDNEAPPFTLRETEVITRIIRQAQQGPPGPPGTGGGGGGGSFVTFNFSFGDASPAFLTTVPTNKHIYTVELLIDTAFNGTGAALSVGRTGATGELQAITENAPAVVGSYETNPNNKYGSATAINLYITPGSGASTGTGQVRLEIEP